MKNKNGWVKIYLAVMVIITMVISFITIYDIAAKGDVLWGLFVGLQVGLFVSYERKRKQKSLLIAERAEI